MNNFEYVNPTKIIFGENTIPKIRNEIPKNANFIEGFIWDRLLKKGFNLTQTAKIV